MSRTDRKLWAEQTLEILERGRYTNLSGETVELAAAITACRAATRLFPPSALYDFRDAVLTAPSPDLPSRMAVVNETTLQGIARLARKADDGDLAALNFASARNAGGGFLGARRRRKNRSHAARRCMPRSCRRRRSTTTIAARRRCSIRTR